MNSDKREIRIELRDGTPVLIRQIKPGDKDYLKQIVENLSLQSRYYRFHCAKRTLSEEELRALTEVDHERHDAWAAFDLSGDAVRPVGIARYVRLRDEDEAADIAITVIDSYQGKGLGSLLLGILASRAAENDIKAFCSIEVYDNRKLFDLIRGLDATHRYLGGPDVQVEFPLHTNPADYPATIAGDMLRRGYELYSSASGSA